MKILQILPNVPPTRCGIGDYGWRLGRKLRDDHGHSVAFLSAGTKGAVPESSTEFPVLSLSRLSAAGLEQGWKDAGGVDVVLLHVSLYGYQRRAVPFWLASGMELLTRKRPRPGIVLMFHELYASGPIHSSAFWLQPFQKRILRRLQRTGDVLRTNRRRYAGWLETALPPGTPPVTVMPVFSNFGELAVPSRLADRPPAMVMFGSGIHGGRDAAATLQQATEAAGALGLKRLHLLGSVEGSPDRIGPVEVVRHAALPAEELSALFARCRVAYSAYHPLYLGKSTVLAAYAAHGLAVLQAGDELPETLPDGLRVGRELLAAAMVRREAPAAGALQLAANRLHAWYAPHDLAQHARSYAQDIQVARDLRR